ncbi:hypothetical protein KBY82_04375 [Cyanobium sp. AMD-g]|uniref:hypothetical protein n=1 Tax=Cyanobium sp. AMD-g TaxID=2823699 RepID=UPI0020CEBD24|nr:hypothetical protein [Cyanobium sp. AMD-g]MCP9930016.1 hypothetical protein [Cyanobium sp. AMD-g]
MAFQVGLLAICLLILYGLVVLAASLPPRLLDPAWQLRFTGALINNGFLALLGLALLHLAVFLDPANPHLVRRRDNFAALALAAVLGFLLLIPLQGYAVWRGISSANSQQNTQLREVTGRLSAVREAVKRASSTQDLQRRLEGLRVPPLGAAELAQPLPELRKSMLETLERTEIRAGDQLRGIQPAGLWPIIQGSIRVVLSALVLVVGFAAFSRRRNWSMTLLQSCLARFEQRRGAFGSRRRGLFKRHNHCKADAFLQSLCDEGTTTAGPSPSHRRN